ncbi:MAG TPA: hypothetical protein EYH02_01545 [Ignisphaera aggregans]|uniref:ArsR family transcriptional regulator n=1 Tax=Ignisphaera aggregans TaxID=334771 RepID=A0A832YXR0_9CREN|nr:hypothetical protein [Ignisphaera aggregans]
MNYDKYEYAEYVYNEKKSDEEGVVNKLGLRVVYEDPEVLVVTAPNEDELRNIILNLLREKPMSVKEIHAILAGIASEDKIRRSLLRLSEEGIVVLDEDGRYRLLGFL